MNSKNIFLSFDIDGTLINCTNGREIQRNSLLYAFNKFFGRKVDPKDMFGPMRVGITDSLTAKGIIEKHKGSCTTQDVSNFLKSYDNHFLNSDLEIPEVLPGIIDVLQKVRQINGVTVGLATGNTRETAKFKLEKAKLLQYFDPFIGGFGDNTYRWLCIHQAKRVAQIIKKSNFYHAIHIGDTHDDVESALKAGAHPIGVMTGNGATVYTPGMKYFVKDLKQDQNVLFDMIRRLQQ